MVVAEVEGGDGGVEEVAGEVGGEGRQRSGDADISPRGSGEARGFELVDFVCVDLHGGIIADRRGGTRGEWGRAGILRTGVGDRVRKCWEWTVVSFGPEGAGGLVVVVV